MVKVLAALVALWPMAAAAQLFTPVDIPAHSYTGGWEYFVGGGVAVFDCNQDGFPDLFVAGGSGPASLLVNTTAVRGNDIGFAAAPIAPLTGVTGAYPLDIDSDGYIDLVVLRVGPNILLRGGPDCGFTPFSPALGFASADRWTTAFSATWERGQTLPTLAFGNYVNRQDPNGPFEACDQNTLYRPDGPIYGPGQALTPGYCALSVLFTDWGRKGRADLRISNDRHYYVHGGSEQMWAMEPAPRLYTQNDGWRTFNLWGMGIASRDITGDGLPEVFLSSMGDQRLQQLEPGDTPTYKDVTYARGTTAQRPYTGGDGRPSTGWQIAFGDAQNDGLDDVFIAKGNVQEMPGLAMQDPNNLLIQRADGRFEERGLKAGLADMARGRGAAFEDLNLDGRADIVVVNREAPLKVYQNQTADTGNWVLLSLRQPAPNVNAIGAWIDLTDGTRTWTRELTVGGGHASGTLTFQHFGVGAASDLRLRVVWPGGQKSRWQALVPNQILRVEPDGEGLRLTPL